MPPISAMGCEGPLNAFFFLLIGVISQRLAMVRKKEGNKHTWRAQYTGELYAAFGKDESLPKRNPLILSQLDGPAAPSKRIEEASDSFMHAPLGSGGYSSVGRAPLLQLGRCDYGLDV
ncbi:hypothetical protein TIFTF001_056149 [Ficus carica]|uniref:Uncharacterized protein n=1 Tax=Ficus carica TaxID=3494 RepID=A0AA88EFD6_FICCA|nr:hypothetical protein TIFTF001_056149 [Ficus carica]